MAGNGLDWLEPPRNKADFDALDAKLQSHCEEFYARLMNVATVTNMRLRKPKSGSRWAERLAWARVDLRAYARSVSQPMAKSAGAVIAAGKAFRQSHVNFSNIQRTTQKSNGTGSGFDFS